MYQITSNMTEITVLYSREWRIFKYSLIFSLYVNPCPGRLLKAGAVSSEKMTENVLKVWKTLALSNGFFYSKNKFQGSAVMDLLATRLKVFSL